MPKGIYKRKGRRKPLEDDGGEESAIETKVSAELQDVIRALPGDEKVELYRESLDDSGKYAFLSSVQASIFSTDWVQKNCGGGNYMVLVRKPGSHELLAKRFFEIDPSIGRRAPFQVGDDKMATLGDGGMPPMMAMMLQMQQSSSDRMMEMMQANSSQITTILAAMISRPNELAGIVGAVSQLAPKAQDPIELATRLAELTKGRGHGESGSLTDKLEEFQLLKRLFTGGADDETGGWAGLVRDFLPGTLSVLQEAVKRREAAPALPAPAPVAGALSPGQPDPLSLIVQPPLSTQLRALVPQLVKRGLQGGDPESFASVIIEDIPVGLFPQIHKALAEEGIIDAIISAAPELEPVREYATHFLTAILEMTAEDEPEIQSPTTHAGVAKPKKGGKAK